MSAAPLRIAGSLVHDARSYVQPDGVAWLQVEFAMRGSPLSVRASRRLGQGPAAQIAAGNAAHHLRRGATVIVHASRFDIVLGRTPHLVLLDVQAIEHQPVVDQREAA